MVQALLSQQIHVFVCYVSFKKNSTVDLFLTAGFTVIFTESFKKLEAEFNKILTDQITVIVFNIKNRKLIFQLKVE